MLFIKPKKKNNHVALKVLAIVAGAAAVAGAGFVVYTKFIKPLLNKKKAAADEFFCDGECDELIEIVECDDEIEVGETEAEEILSEEE